MGIIGLTHDEQGQVKIRRSVVTKIAIGIPPTAGKNYPSTIDHFRILKKGTIDGKAGWVADTEKQEYYKKINGGNEPTSLSIVLLDDNPEEVLRSEYAWYVATGKKCYGDGEKATRRTEAHPDGAPYTPCANHDCKDLERGDCKPSADLYFMLADFPSLGTVCRLHTSSYQSIPELHSALVDLRSMMGGRLLGLPVKLFMRPEKNVYTDNNGQRVTGKTKYILGLELSASSLPKMLESVSESAKVFSELRQLMRGRKLEIEEDDNERGEELTPEFYPADKLLNAAPIEPVVDPLIAECRALMESAGVNAAGQSMMLGQYQGRLPELKAMLDKSAAPKDSPKPETAVQTGQVGASSKPTAAPRSRGRGKGQLNEGGAGSGTTAPTSDAAPPAKASGGFAF